MRVGLGQLRLSPRDFWGMTPRELTAALQGAFGWRPARDGMDHAALAALVARYPD